jgi:hypothetical protein
MWAESEGTQSDTSAKQYSPSIQVKMKRIKKFFREHYEEALCSVGPLSGISLRREDINSGFVCIKPRVDE